MLNPFQASEQQALDAYAKSLSKIKPHAHTTEMPCPTCERATFNTAIKAGREER